MSLYAPPLFPADLDGEGALGGQAVARQGG